MKVFDVIFYYYDRFMRLFEDFEPEFSAMLPMAGYLTLTMGGPMCFIIVSVLGYRWEIVLIPTAVIFAFFYVKFYRRYIKYGGYKQIRREKPQIINKTVSIIIAVAYAALPVVSLCGFAAIGKNWH